MPSFASIHKMFRSITHNSSKRPPSLQTKMMQNKRVLVVSETMLISKNASTILAHDTAPLPIKKRRLSYNEKQAVFSFRPTRRRKTVRRAPLAGPDAPSLKSSSSSSPHHHRRVTFATSVVTKCFEVVSWTNEQKASLFYSTTDYARFALQERVRREALTLTHILGREQRNRFCNGIHLLTSTTIHHMYHKILSRLDHCDASTTPSNTSFLHSCSHPPTNSTTCRGCRAHVVAARCA